MDQHNKEDYFAKKYGMTRTHSEVIEALKIVPPGKALDLGCGNGRNSLYIRLCGFDVTSYDRNEASLENLRKMIASEDMSNIDVHTYDINRAEITGHFGLIVSTVTFMFLNSDRIPDIIANMQEHTLAGGYNLIVSVVSSEDTSCDVPFSFVFSPGELQNYYTDWEILKYNENLGELHRTDAAGNRIKARFATMLARKAG
nr:tellurite resistance methyltransferase TehB [Edaphovirga cremea]